MPKTPKSPGSREARHNPLTEDYAPSNPWKQKSAKRRKTSRDDTEEARFVDSRASRKILDIGRDLAEEDEQENQARRPPAANPAFNFESRLGEDYAVRPTDSHDDDEDVWEPEDDDDDEAVEGTDPDPLDLATWNKMMPSSSTIKPPTWPGQDAQEEEQQEQGPGTDLSALILQRIAEAEARNGSGPNQDILGGGDPDDAIELPAKVVEVYQQIGLLMKHYKSGKLAKPFKILPTVPQWETLLAITRPEEWSPNAVYAATRVFVSSTPYIAQTYLNMVLLPAVQDNIRETQKLNVHLYNALKKALYKPSAFFKAIVFPMLADGTCSQREAHIVSSVVAKISVPVLHSAAALHRLCELAAEQMSSDPDAAGPVNIFIKVLLEKKYALPFKVLDALVFHFLRFRAVGASNGDAMAVDSESAGEGLGGTGKLPVVWHQGLLAFAERYKNDITEDQREALLDLLLTRGHRTIGPEVRRELLAGRGRGVPLEPPAVGIDGDDTMMMAVEA